MLPLVLTGGLTLRNMIDTIEMRIVIHPHRLTAGTDAGMPVWTNSKRGPGYRSYHLDQTRIATDGAYYPTITGTYAAGYGNRPDSAYVNIRFSAPKLVYGNNLQELRDTDAAEVLRTLAQRLMRLGLIVSITQLANAEVKAVHYSKNIVLTGATTVSQALADIKRVNLSRKMAWKEIHYANGGESVAFSSKSHRFVMYDKIADLARTRNNVDAQPLNSDPDIHATWAGTQVFRTEVQINTVRKLTSLFESHGWTGRPTFGDIFSEEKSQAVLLSYWGRHIEPDLALFAGHASPQGMLEIILRSLGPRTRQRAKTALASVALVLLAEEPEGVTGIRNALQDTIGNIGWHRILVMLRHATRIVAVPVGGNWYAQVLAGLHSFEHLSEANRTTSKYDVTDNEGKRLL